MIKKNDLTKKVKLFIERFSLIYQKINNKHVKEKLSKELQTLFSLVVIYGSICLSLILIASMLFIYAISKPVDYSLNCEIDGIHLEDISGNYTFEDIDFGLSKLVNRTVPYECWSGNPKKCVMPEKVSCSMSGSTPAYFSVLSLLVVDFFSY